ncbi:MAG: hypothetical protein ABIJ43_04155 [Candidatus Beckwithbacteria bacterium]
MQKFSKFTKTKSKQKLLFSIVFILAILVRFWKIEYLPYQSDWDEYAYIFAGQSLIEIGIPTSVTCFYSDYDIKIIKNIKATLPSLVSHNSEESYDFVQPWFDHTPLLPLIVGSWVKLFGYNFPSHIPSLIYRLPMLALSAVTLYLIFLISKHFFKFNGGIFSLILFGFSPSLIIIQRMVVSENLFIPFLLITLYLALKNKPLFFQILFTILAGLSKITGLITIPIVGFYYLLKKEYKKTAIYAINSLILFMIIYGLYGYSIDWPQFIQILKTQSFKLLGWTNPTYLLSYPSFHRILLMDMSYYLILILGLVSIFIKSRKLIINYFLTCAIFGSIVLVWITSTENAALGWYKLPLFTFLSISAGRMIKNSFNYPLILLLTMTIINNYGLIRYQEHPYPEFWPFRLFIVLIFGTIFIFSLIPNIKNRFRCLLINILLAIYILTSIYVIDNYYISTCENIVKCPMPLMTLKQLIKP